MLDLVIRGGLVVTPEEVESAILGSRMVLSSRSPRRAPCLRRRFGLSRPRATLLPGGIEPHAHIAIPVPERWAGRPEVMTQPPEAASRAAAFGGVTTVIDFAGNLNPPLGHEPAPLSIPAEVDSRRDVFRGHAYTDFAFHYILAGQVAPATLGQIGEAVQEGIASFKIFTTFPDLRVPYGHLWAVFAEVAKHGGIMAVHAEEDDIVTYMTEKLIREGNAQGHNLHLVHNNLSEDLAFRKIVRLARHTEVGVYFVHTTAKEGVAAIAEARSQGQPVYGEALHNYLEFTCEDYKKPGGTAIHTYPAIKFAEDRDALLAGLLDGRLTPQRRMNTPPTKASNYPATPSRPCVVAITASRHACQ